MSEEPDRSFDWRQRARMFAEEADRLRAILEQHGIDPGGGGPHPPGMDARLAALEAAVQRIDLDLAEIKGRLSNLPTTWHLGMMQAAIILAVCGAAFALVKTLAH